MGTVEVLVVKLGPLSLLDNSVCEPGEVMVVPSWKRETVWTDDMEEAKE